MRGGLVISFVNGCRKGVFLLWRCGVVKSMSQFCCCDCVGIGFGGDGSDNDGGGGGGSDGWCTGGLSWFFIAIF